MCVTLDIWRSQDILQESVLSSYPIDSGAQSVASRLGRKHLHLQSRFTSLTFSCRFIMGFHLFL